MLVLALTNTYMQLSRIQCGMQIRIIENKIFCNAWQIKFCCGSRCRKYYTNTHTINQPTQCKITCVKYFKLFKHSRNEQQTDFLFIFKF